MIEETRCHVCRSYLDCEDLFCSNCGTENPTGLDADGVGRESSVAKSQQQASVMSFSCEQCGASMSYDASAKSLRCPFCGSTQLQSRTDARTLRPQGVVPFQVAATQVESVLRDWLSKGFWKPDDAAQRSTIDKVTQVYVPFWVFSASTETAWTADSSNVPARARGSWVPMSGTRNGQYAGVLVGASGTLTPMEIQEIAPFDLRQAIPPEQIDLLNVIVEEFRVTRRDARGRAASLVERMESSQAQQAVPGRVRNLHVNVRMQDMASVPMLLPIWIMAYHYRDHPFRVLVNGQTGEVYGQAPFSYSKLTVVVAVMFLVVLVVIVLIAMISSIH